LICISAWWEYALLRATLSAPPLPTDGTSTTYTTRPEAAPLLSPAPLRELTSVESAYSAYSTPPCWLSYYTTSHPALLNGGRVELRSAYVSRSPCYCPTPHGPIPRTKESQPQVAPPPPRVKKRLRDASGWRTAGCRRAHHHGSWEPSRRLRRAFPWNQPTCSTGRRGGWR
jgi:hypothetical protein